jgi:hypothetical protein
VKKVIPDEFTAARIGAATGKDFRVFTYKQVGTGLTLFAVEVVTSDGKVIETIVTQ